jgi:conjugative transfer signal peptidase TraF
MKRNPVAAGVAIGGMAVLAAGLACTAAGLRINATKSIPLGVYRTSSAPAEKGAYVLFCPPPTELFKEAKARLYIGAGFCPGGYGYMMKRILAAKGDSVTVADEGVRVNGALLPLSAPLRFDRDGRTLLRYPAAGFMLRASEALLMSDTSATSFDGRYFGPMPLSQIKTVIVPVLTWQGRIQPIKPRSHTK